MTLLAAYNFDEASGAVVDVTGNGHGFTPDASITRQIGHTNTGLRHENTSANSVGPAIFGQTAQRTLMAWVKRTSNAVDGWIVEMKNTTADTGVWGFLYSGSSVQARAKNASNAATFATAAQPSVNNWHHLAMTYDGTTIRLYIDGTQAATAAFAGPVWTAATIFPFFDTVGAETVIDDVRVYDTALSQAQIAADMATPVSGASAFSGSVALSGAGSVSNAGTPAVSGASALSGSGTLAGAGRPATSGGLGLSGTGSAADNGTPAMPGTAALAGSGALAGTGEPSTVDSVGFAGSGALALGGAPAAPGAVDLGGTGGLAAVGTPSPAGAVDLSGAGALTAAGQPALPGNLQLSGGGTLIGSAGDNYTGAIELSGSGAIDLNGKIAAQGDLNLIGVGALVGAGKPAAGGVLGLAGAGAFEASGGTTPEPGAPGHLVATVSQSLTAAGRLSVLTATTQPASSLETSDGV